MTPTNLPSEDVAYVRITTPFSATLLRDFCANLERLYRINSMLEFTEWRQIDSNHYYLQVDNLSNAQTIATELKWEETIDGFKISYSEGLKSATFINIETDSQGTALIIIDDYSGLPEAERTQRLAEVDHSLIQWGNDLYHYLRNWYRWHWFPPFRWYMQRVWQPMKPSGRRITYMLIVITLFDLIALLVLMVNYE